VAHFDIRSLIVGRTATAIARGLQHAREVVAVTRAALREDTRTYMRRRADRAIVVTYEDEHVADGCTISTRWSCVVPAQRGDE
jgi:hypothetical protein